jgi:hypothetical protein
MNCFGGINYIGRVRAKREERRGEGVGGRGNLNFLSTWIPFLVFIGQITNLK